MKRAKILSLLLSFALLLSLVTLPAAAGDKGAFPDVEGHWSEESVGRWAGYGVLNGDENGTFSPDKSMTRAEFATMLVNLMGYTEKAQNTFQDVAANAWYADAILKLAAAGVMKGDGVNAKSMLALMTQGLSCGTAIVISADGEDEQDAVKALVELIKSGCGE